MLDKKSQIDNLVDKYKGLIISNSDIDKFIQNDSLLDKVGNDYLIYFAKDWQIGELDSKGNLLYLLRMSIRPKSVIRYLGVGKLGFPFQSDNIEDFLKKLLFKKINMDKLRVKTLKYKSLPKGIKARILKNFTLLAKDIRNVS